MFSKNKNTNNHYKHILALSMVLVFLTVAGFLFQDVSEANTTSRIRVDIDDSLRLNKAIMSVHLRHGVDDVAVMPSLNAEITEQPSPDANTPEPSDDAQVTEQPTASPTEVPTAEPTDIPVSSEPVPTPTPNPAGINYLISVERGQNLWLSRYVDIAGVNESEKKAYKLTYHLAAPEHSKAVTVGKTDGLIKTLHTGTVYIRIDCEKDDEVYAANVVAVKVLAKSQSKSAKKARSIAARIDKMNYTKKLKQGNVASYYNKYYAIKKYMAGFKAYEKYSRVQHDGVKNYLGITNIWKYSRVRSNIENYLSHHKTLIKKIKFISEYEGYVVYFNHRINMSDVVSYAYKQNKKAGKNLKLNMAFTVTDADDERVQAGIGRAVRQSNSVLVKLKNSNFKNGRYHIISRSVFNEMNGNCRFYKVYKKWDKVYFLKKNISIKNAVYKGKKVQKGSVYRTYRSVQKGSNGWYRVRLDNGKTGYVYKKYLARKQPKKYTAVNSSISKYSYANVNKDIQILKNRYSSLITVSTLTKTADGNDIYCVRLGNPNADKKIVLQSTMHAREWLNSQMIMQCIEYYCQNYQAGKYDDVSFKKLFNKVCFYILPMVNPDGVNISQYGLARIKSEKLKKTVKKVAKGQYDTWKANARCVDINRNFKYGFGKGIHEKKKSSGFYGGKKAESEKETQALLKIINLVKPDAVINYHEVGEIIYYRNETSLTALVKEKTGYALIPDDKVKDGSLGNWLDAKKINWCTIETCTGVAPVEHEQYKDLYDKNRDVIAAVARLYMDNM